MTAPTLEEIRKRDADSAATWFKTPSIGACGRAFIDRRALLAMVADLQRELDLEQKICAHRNVIIGEMGAEIEDLKDMTP